MCPRKLHQFVLHTVVTPSQTRGGIRQLGLALESMLLEILLQVAQLLADTSVVEPGVGKTHSRNDQEKSVVAVQTAKLGVGVFNENAVEVDCFVMVSKFTVLDNEHGLAR